TSLHIWRRSSEYYFIDLLAELRRYREKLAVLAAVPPFWISYKKCEQPLPLPSTTTTSEVIRKNVKLGKF
ncbi:unnamed protein product, partial [Adineta steineri]